MKTETTTPTTAPAQAAAPAPTPTPAPAPTFNSKTAAPVAPYRHEKSGRTVGHHQPADNETTHLFSATGVFIATVAKEDAAKSAADSKQAHAVGHEKEEKASKEQAEKIFAKLKNDAAAAAAS